MISLRWKSLPKVPLWEEGVPFLFINGRACVLQFRVYELGADDHYSYSPWEDVTVENV